MGPRFSHLRRPLTSSPHTLGIVGLGLIGGAVALAARKRRRFARIIASDRDRSMLARARRRGVIDGAGSLTDVIAEADRLVLAVPPLAVPDLVPRVLEQMKPLGLATDTASTKRSVVAAIPPMRPSGPWFIPAHPLAGSERSGFAHATADLLDGAPCPLTPRNGTPKRAVREAIAFWRGLGLAPFVVTARAHDRAVAQTSHLPMIVAALLAVRLGPASRRFAGPALRDATRVAASAPRLWSAILCDNQDLVLRSLQRFSADLEWLSGLLARGDWRSLEEVLRRAKRRRDLLSRSGAAGITARSTSRSVSRRADDGFGNWREG
jgi:prephenate dehydrogenase